MLRFVTASGFVLAVAGIACEVSSTSPSLANGTLDGGDAPNDSGLPPSDAASESDATSPLSMPLSCLGPNELFSEGGAVVLTCTATAPTDIFFLPAGATEAVSCGFVYPGPPLLATDGTTLVRAYSSTAGDVRGCAQSGTPSYSPTASMTGPVVASVAAGGGFAFWILDGKLHRCRIAGCNGAPEDIADVTTETALAADASGIYAVAETKLVRFDLDGANRTELGNVGGQILGRPLLENDRLDVVTAAGIVTCAKTGCASGPTTYVKAAGVTKIAADATHVWWLSNETVTRCAKNASPCASPETMATGASSFAVNADSLYLIASQQLSRKAK